jgi:ribosomal protein S4
MTKRLSSKFKVCKYVRGNKKNLWAVAKASKFRSVRILKRDYNSVKQKLNRTSSFGKYLNAKQVLKNFYCNIPEKSFQLLLQKAEKSKSKTIDKLISLLESRLDLTLYRAGFVSSPHMARQLINHGFVCVNTKIISSLNIMLKPGDVIEISQTFPRKKLIAILQQRAFRKNLKIRITNMSPENKKIMAEKVKILNDKNRSLTPRLLNFIKNEKTFALKPTKKLGLIPKHLEVNYQVLKIVFLWEPIFSQVYYPITIQYKRHKNSILYSYNEIMYRD